MRPLQIFNFYEFIGLVAPAKRTLVVEPIVFQSQTLPPNPTALNAGMVLDELPVVEAGACSWVNRLSIANLTSKSNGSCEAIRDSIAWSVSVFTAVRRAYISLSFKATVARNSWFVIFFTAAERTY